MSAALYIYESRSLPGCIAAGRSFSRNRKSRSETMNYVKTQRKLTESFWNNHQWFVQAFDSGIMDHNFTVKSDLIGGIASFTGHGLLLSFDVTKSSRPSELFLQPPWLMFKESAPRCY
jgi:hypothetical protein